ncbi:ERD23 [Enterospora canceri]|uniref:ER lumen protein-retaining receptor n=1 Tax=Enterospora canceri TaxID=1081671 RepID=A0A1Y1S6W9_9MICR|nr:ERD23 [Enterospora canceri]
MDKLTVVSELFCNAAEWLLIASRIIIIRKVLKTKSVSGLSLKTNVLYLITYCLRYLHLRHWFKYSWKIVYSNVIKTAFLFYQFAMVFLIFFRFRKSYYRRHDSFPITVILVVAALAGFLATRNTYWNYYEDLCYNISLALEAVAILPQLVMTQESEDCESMTSKYILTLGLYRFCYFVHFVILRWQKRYIEMFMIVTALVQTGLYLDFFYVYYAYVFNNKEAGLNLEKAGAKDTVSERPKNAFDFTKAI